MNGAAVWIADEEYTDKAEVSAASIRQQMPDLGRVLVTDGRKRPGIFTRILPMPGRRNPGLWYLDSCRWYNMALAQLSGCDRLVFLDTDTYCAAPFYDLLDVLDRYDIVGAHGISRHTAPTVEAIPDAFPELEIGVLGVRCNERAARLFAEWLALYERHPTVYGNNDQGPFREALWNNQDVRLYVVPQEYHCRWGFGGQVCGRVRVLHSRNGDQPAMAAIFNERGGMRLVCTNGVVFRNGKG